MSIDSASDFYEVAAEVRNWGIWGDDDQLGTLNLITDDKVRQAASLVRKGKVFPLGVDFSSDGVWGNNFFRRNPIHLMSVGGGDASDMGLHLSAWPGSGPTEMALADIWKTSVRFTDDVIIMPLQAATQWDALSHVYYDGKLYNGYPATSVTSFGATRDSIDQVDVKGIVSRGVLLDVARFRGVTHLPENYIITAEELDTVCNHQRVVVEPGDIVLIRTGWWTKFPESREAWIARNPGLGWLTALWLHSHGVAAVAADNVAVETGAQQIEGLPPLVMHMLCLRDMGLMFGEIWDLEALAADCAEDGVYEFQLVAPPLRVTGAVGSPVNPIAMK